jgi:histidyl-tRNA synthetase
MSKKTEPARPEARLPKGFSDISASEIRATEKMLGTIRGVFESYGFEPLDTPAIEYSDALGKFLPDQDRPNEGVFSFQDDDDQWLSLRYDLTAPLARYVAENYQNLPKPFRRYQVGPVWRNEKPGPGRVRQFTQFDADTVGASSVAADAELCMLAADTLEKLEVGNRYVVKVNNRKLLDGLLESIGLHKDDNVRQRMAVLRAIDKLDRLGVDGVRALLGKERKDESGDVTRGADLPDRAIEQVMSVFVLGITPLAELTSQDLARAPDLAIEFESRSDRPWYAGMKNPITLAHLGKALPQSPRIEEGLAELETIASLCKGAGYDRVLIDPSVVRGLEYYTGPVFEAELTVPIADDKGPPIRLGSVVSGGRYDGLVERFTGEKVPATGMSIGVSRLLFGLQHLGKYKDSVTQGPVVVLVLDRDRVADYQKMAHDLRGAGIRAELYLGESGMKAQMKYADRRCSPCVVIQGGDERAKGEVTIKDLIEGAERAKEITGNVAWREERPGQFTVPASQMVDAVRQVLARHKS